MTNQDMISSAGTGQEEAKVSLRRSQSSEKSKKPDKDLDYLDSVEKAKGEGKIRIPFKHRFYLATFSLLLSFFSVATPLFTDFANTYQSHSLYTGFMMAQGQMPYSDIFATGGFFYYGAIALAYVLGSSLFLLPIQFLAFYLSGHYLYKIISHMTAKQEIAINTAGLFYLLNAALGFGGLYPIQLATPFVLISLWFLTRYFAGLTRDEGFIVYGFTGAMAYLIEPHTLFFWLVSLLVIAVQKGQKGQFARGFYQFLCLIFGGLLVFYTVGYFVLNMQILSAYIEQAGFYYFSFFALGKDNIFLTMAFQFFVLFASGLLLGALTFFKHIKRKTDRDDIIKSIVFLSFIFSLIFILLSQSFSTYQFLLIAPFGLVLTSLYLDDKCQEIFQGKSRRRKKQGQSRRILSVFLMGHFYLPLLLLAYSLALPVYSYLSALELNQERTLLATYISENTNQDDKIYVWDSSSKIYLASNRQSSARYPIPSVNTIKTSNAQDLEDELLQNKAAYVLINRQESISGTLQANLDTNYQLVQLDGTSSYNLFQKK